ncbi:MAG: gamma-glutamyl-gamma-aminobutyrate hydrolase family protein [Pseudomonadota bacterium]
MVPIVAIPCDLRHADGYDWHAVARQYVDAVQHVAQCLPVLVPALGDALDPEVLLGRVDGVLLTGSRSNVHPGRYGVPATEAYEPFDEARDATTLPLIQAAIAGSVPMLAICRGFQELNVALGGTLMTEVQDEEGRFDHRAPVHDDQSVRFAIRHPVTLQTGCGLAGIFGADTIEVNSLHRQAIGDLAGGLAAEGHAEDGTVEAVSVNGAEAFAYGVQWHPEYWATTDTPSRRLFEAFGAAVHETAAHREAAKLEDYLAARMAAHARMQEQL